MKGRSATKSQKKFWDMLAQYVGCAACRVDGRRNDYVSIHHIDGRTKPWAHWLVLPLCAGHHQSGTGATGLIAVHPDKGEFQKKYGREIDLLERCVDYLLARGLDVPEAAIDAIGAKL